MSRRNHKNKKYSKELRVEAVEAYLRGEGTQKEICKKFGIIDRRQLHNWILWYNGHRETEIVAFCIEHGKDYGLTVETYDVSYQQVYSWVRKYEEKGVRGLTDRRGKAKPEEEMTESDRLRQENKILKAKIKDQEMEIALLKKLRELRGGGH